MAQKPSVSIALKNLRKVVQYGFMDWIHYAVLGLAVAMKQPLDMVSELLDREQIGLAMIATPCTSNDPNVDLTGAICRPWIDGDITPQPYQLTIVCMDHMNCRHFIDIKTGSYDLNMMRLEDCGMWFGKDSLSDMDRYRTDAGPFKKSSDSNNNNNHNNSSNSNYRHSRHSSLVAYDALSFPVIEVEIATMTNTNASGSMTMSSPNIQMGTLV